MDVRSIKQKILDGLSFGGNINPYINMEYIMLRAIFDNMKEFLISFYVGYFLGVVTVYLFI